MRNNNGDAVSAYIFKFIIPCHDILLLRGNTNRYKVTYNPFDQRTLKIKSPYLNKNKHGVKRRYNKDKTDVKMKI